MPKKRKSKNKQQLKIVKQRDIRVVEPEMILEREIAQEDQDLRRAKVTEILEGFRRDREKRGGELRSLMGELRNQRIKRREAIQRFMQGLRQNVLNKKKMMPAVNL